jgi:precorrin-6B methylase 2
MGLSRCALRVLAAFFAAAALGAAHAQEAAKPYEPTQGQAGRDVVWVPTPPELVEKMLDLARVTPKDFVMDLGSGDGRNVIAAAKRGARALGVEYNPDLVEYSQRLAAKAGVADKAKFVQGDMYEADISQATVLALFLLTENLRKLTPKFLAMKPGSRIVSNTYEIEGWKADVTERLGGDCVSWCTAHLYIVPAQVAGSWKMGNGELSFKQEFQMVSGAYKSGGAGTPVRNGRLRGDQITFTLGGTTYTGRVSGNTMRGTSKGAASGAWTATRVVQ